MAYVDEEDSNSGSGEDIEDNTDTTDEESDVRSKKKSLQKVGRLKSKKKYLPFTEEIKFNLSMESKDMLSFFGCYLQSTP